jgi:HEAT repeat protein
MSMRWLSPICWIYLSAFLLLAKDESIPKKAWSILELGLHDKKTEKRAQAVSALGLMANDKRAIQTAEQALQDPDPDVRRAAIKALGDMNAKSSLPQIKTLAEHADAKTVVAIAAVLAKFKDPEGYDIYYQLLTGKRKSGGSVLDGIKDRSAIEKMGIESAIGFLPGGSIGTGAYDYFKHNDQSNIDITAVNELVHDPDPAVSKALVQSAFNGKEAVQLAALTALAKRNDPNVVDEIQPGMYSSKPLISYTTAAAVLHLLDVPAKHRAQR